MVPAKAPDRPANGTIIPHAVDASVDDMQPYLQVRVVQNLQAQTAKGSTQALKAQRKLIINLNQHFLELPARVWQNEQNARAAVIHLLSGGHPAVGHRLLSLDPPPAVDPALLKGALAYIEGRKNEAYSVFSAIDPLSLSPTLGGQIALVQAILALPDNLQDAQTAIDKARLLLPGSLVEEAALRRGVSVAAAENDTRLFQAYSLQYMRRFNNSIYNSDFRRRFAIAMRRFGESKAGASFAELDTVNFRVRHGCATQPLFVALLFKPDRRQCAPLPSRRRRLRCRSRWTARKTSPAPISIWQVR